MAGEGLEDIYLCVCVCVCVCVGGSQQDIDDSYKNQIIQLPREDGEMVVDRALGSTAC